MVNSNKCAVKLCKQPTVEPLPPASGGSISLGSLYCEVHLKEKIDSGEFRPIQFPIPTHKNQ